MADPADFGVDFPSDDDKAGGGETPLPPETAQPSTPERDGQQAADHGARPADGQEPQPDKLPELDDEVQKTLKN